MTYQRKIEVDGKTYTLTANRSIIRTLNNISPNAIKIIMSSGEEMEQKVAIQTGVDIMENLHILFHDLIKVVHKEITLEKASEILDKLESECGNVQTELMEFASSSFIQGDQKKKATIWKS